MLELAVLSDGNADRREWDDFVITHPEARMCHLYGFREVLERAYGYHCVYAKLLREGNLVGIFPAVAATRGGHGRLISQPFNEYGGPLLRESSSLEPDEVANTLLELATAHGCDTVEIRGGLGCESLGSSRLSQSYPLHAYATLPLDSAANIWRKSLTNEARKGANKARAAGLHGEIRVGGTAVEDPFYALYLESMKRLGVPPHPQRFFRSLATGVENHLIASWIFHQDAVVSVLLGAIVGKRLQIYITASSPEAWAIRPNDLAHWELIAWACEQGFEVFDFGSARYEGQIRFKKKWGAGFHAYSVYLLRSAESQGSAKVQFVNTSSPYMDKMAMIWSRTVPLFLTKLLGPPIRKFLTK